MATERRTDEQRFTRRPESGEDARRTEEREVRSEDPTLSPEANRLLTEELQDAVGADRVTVPPGTPDHRRAERGTHSPLTANLIANRQIVIVTLLVALTVGAAVSLVTGSWWALLVALGVHAFGTLTAALGAIQMTTETEHVSPTTAARLEAEGVDDPDRVLSELVEDMQGATQARGATEVAGSGSNERTAAPEDDPAKATVEQRSAITPSSRATEVAGEGSAVEALPWWIAIGVSVLSLAFAIIGGGELWLVPAITVPLALGWAAIQWWMHRRGSRSGGQEVQDDPRRRGDGDRAASGVIPVYVVVVGGTVVFMAIMGWVTGIF